MKKTMDMNKVLSWTLRLGITISAVFLTIGIVLYLFTSSAPSLYDSFIILGIFMLFATPIMRVAMSVFLFAKQKDTLYVIITTIVFINIMIAVFIIPKIMHL